MDDTASSGSTATLSSAVRDGLVGLIDSGQVELPVLSAAASEAISASCDEDCDLTNLADIIGRDPLMTGHLLRISNSALYCSTTQIDSLSQALARMGLNKIRDIAIMISCETRVFNVPGHEEWVRGMFVHSVIAAAFAREAAGLVEVNADEAFLGGLLHDVGKPVVLQTALDLKTRINIKTRKMEKLPEGLLGELADEFHCSLGASLVDSWQLPGSLGEAIRHHHDPECAAESGQLARVLRFADRLAHLSLGSQEVEEEELFGIFTGQEQAVGLLLERRDEIVEQARSVA